MCQAVLGTGDMALQIEQMKLPVRVELPLWEGAVLLTAARGRCNDVCAEA